MLKSMRKNVKTLAPTLWIVIAAFVIAIFAVWGGAGRLGESARANTLAVVGKEKISSDAYFQTLRQRLEGLKKEFKELDRSFIQQLNIPQQVLEQMVQQSLLLQLGRDFGITASDQEIRTKIMSYPVFQRDGKFIGSKEYQQILNWNRIPLSQFEDSLRDEVIINKVVQFLTAGIAVTPDEMWENYRKSNESAKIEYLVLETEKIEFSEIPEAAEIQSYFENHKDEYKIPEKREAVYIFFKTEDTKKEVKIEDADIAKYYKENTSQFRESEQVRVSRIFLPFTEQDRPSVLEQAKGLLDRIKTGQDFPELAKAYSKDEQAKDGGDWGLTEWKSLSAQETSAVQGLEAGRVSDILELEAGASILKVTEKTPAVTKTLEEVKGTIRSILEDQKARDLAGERVARLEKSARKEKSLDVAAQKEGLKVRTTGLLKEGEPVSDVDSSGAISQSLFSLKVKEISAPIYSYQGTGLAQLEKIEPPRPAKLDEVREEVEKDIAGAKKKEKALEKIREVRNLLREDNWEEIAQKNGLEFKSVEAHKREQYLGTIGENPEADRLAFSLPLKEVSQAVGYDGGYVLLRVLERKEVTRPDFEKNRATEKETLLETKKNKFLQSYLNKIREEKKVRINYKSFVEISSDVVSRAIGE